jgi:hypothetical protein
VRAEDVMVMPVGARGRVSCGEATTSTSQSHRKIMASFSRLQLAAALIGSISLVYS